MLRWGKNWDMIHWRLHHLCGQETDIWSEWWKQKQRQSQRQRQTQRQRQRPFWSHKACTMWASDRRHSETEWSGCFCSSYTLELWSQIHHKVQVSPPTECSFHHWASCDIQWNTSLFSLCWWVAVMPLYMILCSNTVLFPLPQAIVDISASLLIWNFEYTHFALFSQDFAYYEI